MKKEERPIAVVAHQRRDTRQLWFPNDSQGEYYIRGGIAWPMVTGQGGVSGFALVAGLNVESGVCHVFEQTKFATIDTAIDPIKQTIAVRGLGMWFNEMTAAYQAQKYYHNESESVHRMYLLKILRVPTIVPKPQILQTTWSTPDEPLAAMSEWFSGKRMVIEEGSPLHESINRYRSTSNPTADGDPVLHAFLCLLHGLTLYPWSRRNQERDIFFT